MAAMGIMGRTTWLAKSRTAAYPLSEKEEEYCSVTVTTTGDSLEHASEF
jgi:hypothetical protein